MVAVLKAGDYDYLFPFLFEKTNSFFVRKLLLLFGICDTIKPESYQNVITDADIQIVSILTLLSAVHIINFAKYPIHVSICH